MDDIKLAGKKHNIDPMWKVLNEEVDLGEPTSFLDHVYLGCTQRKCEISKDIVDNYRTMFESRISAGGLEKLPFPQNLRISSWSYDMAGHAKKCVERYCELANKTTQQLYKVSTPCIDDHPLQRRRNKICWRIVKYMLSNCSEMLILGKNWTTRFFLRSVNKLARSITNRTKACDKRLNRLISHIHHTSEYKQYCHVGILLSNADWDCFRTLTLREILKIQNPLQEEHYVYLVVITFVPISWMCKKQTSVSHSSTESEIIPLDTGLRLDGLPAVELWDLIVSIFGNISHVSDRAGATR